ncbi:hypothetical protein CH252_18690 [Rhodococcus sp. 06-1477-1B]|nr:hypothetical protein CH252_18690 [Rhodococcus sp. 06-1477-1B]
MDHITVPAIVRTPAGPDATTLEVSALDGWVAIAPADVGGPTLTVDTCTWRRLIAASARLGV